MYLQAEIAQQPDVIKRLLSEGRADTEAAAAAIRDFDPPFVCIAARGTSDHAAIYAQYLFGHALRLPVMLATPSLHTLYARPADYSRALVIGVSQSGKAEDVKAVLADARRSGALTLAITNFDDSPLAQAARLHLPLRAEREFSVAATKTYTAQLTVIAMLTSALTDERERWDALDEQHRCRVRLSDLPGLRISPARVTAKLPPRAHRSSRSRALADRRLGAETLPLQRQVGHAGARLQNRADSTPPPNSCEISLKVKELTYIASQGYSEADFRHGLVVV